MAKYRADGYIIQDHYQPKCGAKNAKGRNIFCTFQQKCLLSIDNTDIDKVRQSN